MVSFCGSPTYQLSKYLTTVLKPLTDESQHKLQSTENFINAIKTVQVPDDYKLVSFDVKSLFTSIPLQLALDCTETAINNSTNELPLPTDDLMDLLNLCLTSTYFQYNGKHYKQLHEQLWAHQFPLLLQKSLCKASRNEPSQLTNEHYHSGYVTLTIPLQPYTKTKSTIFTNTSTDKTPTYSLLRRSRKMVKYLF